MDRLSLLSALREPGIAAMPALVTSDETLSFGALADRVARASAALTLRGARPHARVAIVAPNSADLAVTALALIAIGATIVPIHPRLTPAEAARLIDRAAPDLTLREGDLARITAHEARGAALPSAPIDPEDPLAIIFTSGTSGAPKGAVLSRRAFLASARASAQNLGVQRDDRWLLCMPLCHVGGLSVLTRSLIAERAVVLVPRFDAGEVIDAVARHRATQISVVPTMLRALLDADRSNALARLRAVLVGGAAASMTLMNEAIDRGVRAITTYGLTEACSQVTTQPLSDPQLIRAGSGLPLPGTTVRIRDDGHILVRGPTLMTGYDRGPGRAPDPSVDGEGFFDTGDLGSFDDQGHLHVLARRTDLIVTGGENVYPVEVEQVIEAFPGVRRALVIGVPDDRWGARVCAVIEADRAIDRAAIARYFAEQLAPHKRPRALACVDALPSSPAGKLVRAGAAERFAGALTPIEVGRSVDAPSDHGRR